MKIIGSRCRHDGKSCADRIRVDIIRRIPPLGNAGDLCELFKDDGQSMFDQLMLFIVEAIGAKFFVFDDHRWNISAGTCYDGALHLLCIWSVMNRFACSC